jgi:hypothetical protein
MTVIKLIDFFSDYDCSTRSIRESVFGAIQQVWTILHVNRADIGNLGFLDILRSKQDLAFEAVSQVNSDSLPRYGD